MRPRPSAAATAPPLPAAVTHHTVRTAIANALESVRAQELAEECVQFGLEPQRDDEDSPWAGKWRYVERRLRHRELPELLDLAARVQVVYESAELAHLLGMAAGDGVAGELKNPHRPLTAAEVKRRHGLAAYLDRCSEDELIEEVLLPLFRQLGFHRITAAGHKDKALEYGKDIWMRYTLPTQHTLYFGIQAKKGKIDASGVTKRDNANVAEIHHQALMMLAHEVFDPETNKRVLVDHAFIVAGGEITKAARNWIGNALDALKRSQIMFMDRADILNLYVVTNLPLPADALPQVPASQGSVRSDEPPF
jgi:hypothetical protein